MESTETEVRHEDPPETVNEVVSAEPKASQSSDHSFVPEGSGARLAARPLTDEVKNIDLDTAEKRGGPEQEMAALREDMGITETVDPLKALLEAPIGPQSGVWKCPRLNTEFTIRSLDNDAYAEAQEEATRYARNRRTGRMEKDIDGATLSFLVCVAGTTNPNFNAEPVKARFHAMSARDAVKKALLPGEIDKLAEKILQLSGFDEDVEEQGKD